MELENLYEIFKGVLPYADKFFPEEHPLNAKLKDVKQIMALVESMGGIDNLTKFFNTKPQKPTPQPEYNVVSTRNNNLPPIDSLPKLAMLDF